ncbi:MAG: hypothetical protein OEV81_09640 [Betaproteobacteria bacterium]|nr:hypothetical protein [Betaproteobacteria bacterium]MDH5222076.1 hypothetical protein [Betaproteobacteria bacterium]MDH5351643.1 hypothetical protein [Betaproteobacteria bacterium]
MESTVRIIVTPSSTRLPPETPGSVVVSGSHSAIFTVYLAARGRARAAILHDAGIGLDEAGVSGLAWAEKLGMAVAAVAASSARIGDGDDLMRRGVLSRVNRIAAACGVTAGMTCREAAERLRDAPLPVATPEPREETRYVHEKAEGRRRGIASVDSVALMTVQDEGQVMATGSHAALAAGEYVVKIRPRLSIGNDASMGIENAGIASLQALGQAGIAAAAVSSTTARIGDGRSTLLEGVISALNREATLIGGKVGMKALELARLAAAG